MKVWLSDIRVHRQRPPCIHGDYAGAAEWLPRDYKVLRAGTRYEGLYCCNRPIYDPHDWANLAMALGAAGIADSRLDLGQSLAALEGMAYRGAWTKKMLELYTMICAKCKLDKEPFLFTPSQINRSYRVCRKCAAARQGHEFGAGTAKGYAKFQYGLNQAEKNKNNISSVREEI